MLESEGCNTAALLSIALRAESAPESVMSSSVCHWSLLLSTPQEGCDVNILQEVRPPPTISALEEGFLTFFEWALMDFEASSLDPHEFLKAEVAATKLRVSLPDLMCCQDSGICPKHASAFRRLALAHVTNKSLAPQHQVPHQSQSPVDILAATAGTYL